MTSTIRLRSTLIATGAAFAAVLAMSAPGAATAAATTAATAATSASTSASAAATSSPSASTAPGAVSAPSPTTANDGSRATRLVHRDPAGDVQSARIRDEDMRPAPANKNADIRQVKVRYEHGKVVFTMKTRRMLPRKNSVVIADIRTPADDFEVTQMNLFGERDLTLRRGQRTVRCEGLTVRRDGAHRRVRIVVPASCIGNPKRVQPGIGAIVVKHERSYADDGFSDRIGHNLALSRWIR